MATGMNTVPRKASGAAVRRTITISWAAAGSLCCGVLLLLGIACVFFAWAGRHAVIAGPRLSPYSRRAIIGLADFIPSARNLAVELLGRVDSTPYPLLTYSSSGNRTPGSNPIGAASDPGYLLLSHLSHEAKQGIVSLIRLSDGRVTAVWKPDFDRIGAAQALRRPDMPRIARFNGLTANPVLMPNGDIVFNSFGPLVRQSACGELVWVLDGTFNHSNEVDDRDHIWVPSFYDEPFPDNPSLNGEIRDSAVAEISPDGKVLGTQSFSRILIDNGLRALLLGRSAEKLLQDPIHMNSILPAPSDSPSWKKGDLLISSRHMSTVFLFRPSTRRIVWYKTGPWMNQHNATFLDSSRISIFGNDIIAYGPLFLHPGDTNQVYVYDFATDAVSTPFHDLMQGQKIRTPTQGRGQILPDGGLFVEETDSGRLLRFLPDRLLWSWVNWYDDHHIGAVSWSRYLTAEQVREPLAAIAARKCGAS
jgi:hypothetical protein